MSIENIRSGISTFFSDTAGTIGGAIANAKASDNAVISGIAKAILTKWSVVVILAGVGAGCGYKAYYNFQAWRAGVPATLDTVPAKVNEAAVGDVKKDTSGTEMLDAEKNPIKWTQAEIDADNHEFVAATAANAPKIAANNLITDARNQFIGQTVAAVAFVASAIFVAVSF